MLFLHLLPLNENYEPLALEYALSAPDSSPAGAPGNRGLVIIPPRAGVFPAPEYSAALPQDPVAMLNNAEPLPELREKVRAIFEDPGADIIVLTSFRFLTALKKLFLRLLLPDLIRNKKCVSARSLVRAAALYKGIWPESASRNLKKAYEGITGRPETQLSGARGLLGLLKQRESRLLDYFLKASLLSLPGAVVPFASAKILAALGENSFMMFTPLLSASDGSILVWDLSRSPADPENRGDGFVKLYDRGDILISPAGTVSRNVLDQYGIASAGIRENSALLTGLMNQEEFREEACLAAIPSEEALTEIRSCGSTEGLNALDVLTEHPGYCRIAAGSADPGRLLSLLPGLSGELRHLALDYLYTTAPELLDQQYAQLYGELVRERIAGKRDDFILRLNDLAEKNRQNPECLKRLKNLYDYLAQS